VFLKNEDSKGASKMYNSMANIFKSQGDYTRAIEFYSNSVSQAKVAKDDGSMAYANFNMASVFVDLEQYNKALDYAQSSLDYFKKIGLESNIASCYNLMGVISRTNDDQKGAFEYFMRAMQISKSNNFKDALSGAYVNIGDYFKYQGDYLTAMDQYQKSLRFYKELDYRVGVSKVLAKMGTLCNIENKHEQAWKYCQNGLLIAEEIGVMVQERDNCLCLSTASVGIGKDKSGLELKKRYVLLRDSLKNMDIQRESVRIDGQVAYDRYILEQKLEKDKEIALTALQSKKRQFLIYCLSGGGATLVLLALVLFKRFQIVRKARFKIESLKSLLVMIHDKAPEDQKKLIQLEFEN
jgi:tetratricopeptide (TPR) repeat protein